MKKKNNVSILNINIDDMYYVLFLAYKECVSKISSRELIKTLDKNDPKIKESIKRLVATNHGSPLEHIIITFAIDNISRACSHQLVRHRIAAISQKSQRFIKTENFIGYDKFILPEAIENDNEMKKSFYKVIDEINEFVKLGQSKNIASEDLRCVLPNATATSLIFSTNCRNLKDFFNTRLCQRAQKEIRFLAKNMLDLVSKELPEIFSVDEFPSCKKYGVCFETPKNSCNPAICIENLKDKFKLKDKLKDNI